MAENPSNIVPDQIILLEGGSKLVPAPSSSDSGKVLAVLNTNGDIGWAEDREGMAQQQADWAEQDSSKVTFIANKPTIPVVDQTYSASSTNAQSGRAVAEAVVAIDNKVSTTQASQTEVDIGIKGDAPIKLIAEDYGSEAGPSVAATFRVAQVRTSAPNGVEVIFDLPAPQHLPLNAQITIAEDISGSDPTKYQLDNYNYFGRAVNDSISTSDYFLLTSFNATDSDRHTFLAGTYNVALTSGNPDAEINQVGFTLNGNGAPGAWDEIRDYIIANASTLFTITVPSTVKTARLLPAASSTDANKVLRVDSNGKPAWGSISVPTVDQTYKASSTNAQSGVAVAGALANINQVPASAQADENKVLTVNASGTPVWANSQGGSSVEAGEGLFKSGDTLSVTVGEGGLLHFGTEILGYAGEEDGIYTVKSSDLYKVWYVRTAGATFESEWIWGSSKPDKAYLYIANGPDLNGASNVGKYTPQYSGEVSFNTTLVGNNTFITISTRDIRLSEAFSQYSVTMEKGTWASLASSQTLYIMFACVFNYQYYTLSYPFNYTKQLYLATDTKLGCTNPLPASTSADANKALVVDANGDPGWGDIPTYTPGSMIDMTNNQISVDTSAGIEDIALVNALPVSPKATTLYLIPEV